MGLCLRLNGAAVCLCAGTALTAVGAFVGAVGGHGTAKADVERQPVLDVQPDPSGGVRAAATLWLPVPPAVVQRVLTDYDRWPELFEMPMRLARVERRGERVVTDLYVKHALLPGERRLLSESEELPGGGVTTTLLGGDFTRYARTWKLSADGDEGRTLAKFTLLVQVDTWAPDWLLAIALRRELETHFRLVRARALALLRAAPSH